MNSLGVHALVWTGEWTEKSSRYAIESSREVGFDLIEIPVLEPEIINIERTRGQLADNGLQAACSLGLDWDANVADEDPGVVARGRDRLKLAVDVAAGIGAVRLGGVLYSVLGKYPGPATPKARQHVVESMAWLGEYASAAGVPVSLEVVNRYETNIVNTAAEMLTLLDETGSDISIHLDTYHMNIEENGFTEAVEQSAGRLGYVHIGESHRGYLGTGTIDFPQFFTALARSGYTGAITFESFSSAVVHHSLSNQLAVWRNLWDDGRDLAQHAHRFMSEALAEVA